MDITPLVRAGQSIIQSYANGRFRISGTLYEGALLVFPDRVAPWNIGPFEGDPVFTAGDFKPLHEVENRPDVVLLGTGRRQIFLPPDVRKELTAQGLNIEAMDTGAACRTYNVLMAEGRRVAAALVVV